jgi:hypothetical protein
MHWYNPKTRGIEDLPAPSTDLEALETLRGDVNCVEQALIFVGHEFRLRHLRYQPIG